MNRITNILLLTLLILGYRASAQCNSVDSLKSFFGEKLESLKILSDCYQLQDSTLNDLDVSWQGVFAYREDALAVLFESNWMNKSLVSRITIFHPEIKTSEDLSVGCTFGEIRDHVSSKIPPAPDGYLFLTSSKDPSIYFQMDLNHIPESSRLKTGIGDIDLIPSNLKVKSIIINQ